MQKKKICQNCVEKRKFVNLVWFSVRGDHCELQFAQNHATSVCGGLNRYELPELKSPKIKRHQFVAVKTATNCAHTTMLCSSSSSTFSSLSSRNNRDSTPCNNWF